VVTYGAGSVKTSDKTVSTAFHIGQKVIEQCLVFNHDVNNSLLSFWRLIDGDAHDKINWTHVGISRPVLIYGLTMYKLWTTAWPICDDDEIYKGNITEGLTDLIITAAASPPLLISSAVYCVTHLRRYATWLHGWLKRQRSQRIDLYSDLYKR